MKALNRRPIFINSFSRGGSNILMNFLLSHPEVCLALGETHRTFKGDGWEPIWKKYGRRIFNDLPIRISSGQNFFSPLLLEPRKKLPLVIMRYIDYLLYIGRFAGKHLETHNLYRNQDTPYSNEELKKCRLLNKGNNGLVYTIPLFNKLYPDAIFFGLIRHGLALCESHRRRGRSVKKIARIYNSVGTEMLRINAILPNFHLIKFEDILAKPLETLTQVYQLADLEISKLSKVRLQDKAFTTAAGTREYVTGKDRAVLWYDIDQFHKHICNKVNENQIKQLDPRDKETFLEHAGDTLKNLGYC